MNYYPTQIENSAYYAPANISMRQSSLSDPGINNPVGTTVLSYTSPARAWTQALPIGNGRLGAMVWGGAQWIVSI